VEEFSARLVHAFEGVCAEEVTLRLKQICRQSLCTIAIEECQRR
jgi:hypothetical protein